MLALTGTRRRRELESGESGPEVEAGPPDHDRRLSGSQDLVDRVVRELLVLGNRTFVLELPDADEPRRLRRLVGQDRQATVRLHRIRRYELGRKSGRQLLSDGGLARSGRPEQRQHQIAPHAPIVVFA